MGIIEKEKDMREVVLKSAGLSEKDMKEGIYELRLWLKEQSHLPQYPDDHMLEVFLAGCKGLEGARRKLEVFFTARVKIPRLFESRLPENIDWDAIYDMAYLPGLTPGGQKVLFVRIPGDCSFLNMGNIWKAHTLLTEAMLKDEPITAGHITIADCTNLSVSFVSRLSPSAMNDMVKVYIGAYPVRVTAIICFNSPAIAHFMMNTLVKPFLPHKIKKRVKVLKGDHTTIDLVPNEMLPSDYGGLAPSLAELKETTRRRVFELSDWFASDGSAVADVSKMSSESNCSVM